MRGFLCGVHLHHIAQRDRAIIDPLLAPLFVRVSLRHGLRALDCIGQDCTMVLDCTANRQGLHH